MVEFVRVLRFSPLPQNPNFPKFQFDLESDPQLALCPKTWMLKVILPLFVPTCLLVAKLIYNFPAVMDTDEHKYAFHMQTPNEVLFTPRFATIYVTAFATIYSIAISDCLQHCRGRKRSERWCVVNVSLFHAFPYARDHYLRKNLENVVFVLFLYDLREPCEVEGLLTNDSWPGARELFHPCLGLHLHLGEVLIAQKRNNIVHPP